MEVAVARRRTPGSPRNAGPASLRVRSVNSSPHWRGRSPWRARFFQSSPSPCLTIDIPVRSFDYLFSSAATKPSSWLTIGLAAMSLAPLVVILASRRYGGDEASLRRHSSLVSRGRRCRRRTRHSRAGAGGGRFSQPAFHAFPRRRRHDEPVFRRGRLRRHSRRRRLVARAVFLGADRVRRLRPDLFSRRILGERRARGRHWMIAAFALQALLSASFLLVYRWLRRPLRPRGGYGG